MAGVGTSNQMALNPRDGRQTMAERMQFSCARETNWEAMSRTKQRKRGRASGGAELLDHDETALGALTAATMGKR